MILVHSGRPFHPSKGSLPRTPRATMAARMAVWDGPTLAGCSASSKARTRASAVRRAKNARPGGSNANGKHGL